MGPEQRPADWVEIRTGWGPVALAVSCAAGAATALAALTRHLDATTTAVAAACAATLAASFGGLVALWFGAELSRRWSWLFGLSLGWYVTLACLLGELPLWPALVVGLTTALALGTLLARRLAGFARRARGPSFAGAYLGPLLAVPSLLVGGEAGALMFLLALPLAIPFGAVAGALLGAER